MVALAYLLAVHTKTKKLRILYSCATLRDSDEGVWRTLSQMFGVEIERLVVSKDTKISGNVTTLVDEADYCLLDQLIQLPKAGFVCMFTATPQKHKSAIESTIYQKLGIVVRESLIASGPARYNVDPMNLSDFFEFKSNRPKLIYTDRVAEVAALADTHGKELVLDETCAEKLRALRLGVVYV